MPTIEETFLPDTFTGRVSDDEYEEHLNEGLQVQSSAPPQNFYAQQADSFIDDMDEEEELQEQLSDVELRLEEANYYRALLKNPLFGGTSNTISKKVEKEVRDFIKERLRILVGINAGPASKMKMEPAQSVFTNEEVFALKAIAFKINAPKTAPTNQAVPTVNKAVVEEPRKSYEPPVAAQPVPEKVKAPRRKKEEAQTKQIEVELPNGMKVKTNVSTQVKPTQPARKMTPQEMADSMIQFAARESQQPKSHIPNVLQHLIPGK